MKILVTGAAGFIGFHLVKALMKKGYEVVGIDNLNDYYPVSLKHARLKECGIDEELIVQGHVVQSSLYDGYQFVRMDLEDKERLEELFAAHHFDVTVNLAAQAGVRYSIENPYAYVHSNVLGFVNLLECARRWPVRHFVYASSSSVYGGNTKTPFSENDRVDNQVSLYAATKKADEQMANVYSHLYKLPTTGLRFFTVYGPWGRPDMAPMLFSKAIMHGQPIRVFNHGDMQRDFTYIDDIVEGVVRIIDKIPEGDVPSDIFNIGCGHPVQLMDFIRLLEQALGKEAQLQMLPMQKGDVPITYADTTKLEQAVGYKASTPLEVGIRKFAEWIKNFDGYSS
ncbi:MAG: NAD-dependent epimerase [Prevotella sp.]|jgi:UDP-glucuronate 4-epimerase